MHSNYKYVGFIDDDCYPIRNDFLERAYKWLTSKKYRIVGVGGPIYVRSDKTVFFKSKMKGIKSFLNIRLLGGLFMEILETQNYKLEKLTFVNKIQGGSCFFNREILEIFGGFDQRFDGNYIREDTDVSMSIRKHGLLLSDPKMPVNHLHIQYGGCRRSADEFYSNFLSNTIFLILKHKRITIEIIIITLFDLLGLFKILLTGLDHDGFKINRFYFLKSMIYGIVQGFKKYFNPKKKISQAIIIEKKEYDNS